MKKSPATPPVIHTHHDTRNPIGIYEKRVPPLLAYFLEIYKESESKADMKSTHVDVSDASPLHEVQTC